MYVHIFGERRFGEQLPICGSLRLSENCRNAPGMTLLKIATCLIFMFTTLGSPLIDGIFLVQKMCICSCVTLSTTLLMRAVQFNARSACDASC